jgi:hypothetical protein
LDRIEDTGRELAESRVDEFAMFMVQYSTPAFRGFFLAKLAEPALLF